jgi:hypothetical protein
MPVHAFDEHMLINNADHLAVFFQVEHGGRFEKNSNRSMWPMDEYHTWKCPHQTPHAFDDVLPRSALNKLIYGVFFKVALLVMRDHSYMMGNSEMIYNPDNMTLIFRLMIHLHRIGYSSH